MKKMLVLLLVLMVTVVELRYDGVEIVHAQTAARVIQKDDTEFAPINVQVWKGDTEFVPINIQVWAKDYPTVDCGKYSTRAMAERETVKSGNNAAGTNLVLMDSTLFWMCLEVNRQVNGMAARP